MAASLVPILPTGKSARCGLSLKGSCGIGGPNGLISGATPGLSSRDGTSVLDARNDLRFSCANTRSYIQCARAISVQFTPAAICRAGPSPAPP